MRGHGQASYRAGDTRWLFPGRLPGRPIVTETVRGVLVRHGIHPRASRSAALFSLASQIPAPVLADLVGIANTTAVQWAKTRRSRLEQLRRKTAAPRSIKLAQNNVRPPALSRLAACWRGARGRHRRGSTSCCSTLGSWPCK